MLLGRRKAGLAPAATASPRRFRGRRGAPSTKEEVVASVKTIKFGRTPSYPMGYFTTATQRPSAPFTLAIAMDRRAMVMELSPAKIKPAKSGSKNWGVWGEMREILLREISEEFLVPFFSGARLEGRSEKSSPREATVAFRDPVSIAFKASTEDDYRLVLTRPQPFAAANATIVPEIAVVRAFVEVIGPMSEALAGPLKYDFLSTFSRRVVAQALSSPNLPAETLLSGIDQLSRWSSRLYEGSAISAAIGFRMKPQPEGAVSLRAIGAHDFGAVLTNGYDTLLEFDFYERLVGHASLALSGADIWSCALRHAPVAEWTTHDKKRRRVALCLNRGGEILVFRDGKMLFARRSGRWSFLTHEPVLTQMGTPQNTEIRKAVYETCLDASFSRTGACLGIVSSSRMSKLKKVVASEEDFFRRSETTKAKAIRQMIGTRKFHKLDRRLRQELVAIDGATVISFDGDLLAVGAILKIPGGSPSGGRLAAAQQLSKLGVGIKVSQDGGIVGFRLGEKKNPAFQIM